MTHLRAPSQRVTLVQPSATVAVMDKARAMQQQGLDVISLAGGDPDFDTPAHIVDAAIGAMRQGLTHYAPSAGTKELRRVIADKLRSENGLEFDPEAEIIITPGGKMALYAAVLATVDAGDEALILEPAWVSYVPCVQLAGGVSVPVFLDRRDNFRVTRQALEARVTPRTRLVIVNSPNNPTGRVLAREELEAVAAVALGHDLWVISDEIYEKIIFDDREHVSIGTLPDMLERTIVLNGLSKSYAMTGWRLGYVAAAAPLAAAVLKVQQHSTTCAATFTQAAGVAALSGRQDAVQQMVEEYGRRRDIIVDGLNRLPGVTCRRPEGAFYAFPDVSGTGLSSVAFADMLLSEAQIAATPGIAFGESGDAHVRLSFATATATIEKAIDRMARVL